MKQIRKNIFETNSSSTHSVAIYGQSNPPMYEYTLGAYIDPADHYLHMKFGEFGWGYDEYEDDYTKLQYLLTMIAETASNDRFNPKFTNLEEFYALDDFILLESIVCEHIEGCKGINIISEITDKTYDDILDKDGNMYHSLEFDGYIDHQSCEDYNCLADFLEAWDLSIEEFLFNPHVQLIIDNDNG